MIRWTVRMGLVLAVPAIVLGLYQLHAAVVAVPAYEVTELSRLVWVLGFVGLLWAALYVVGAPTLVQTRRGAVSTAMLAVALATLGISLVQLVVGDALLPRFVVFMSSLALVPALSAIGLADLAGRRQAADRDRLFFVGGAQERERLESDLAEGVPERPATLVGSLDLESTGCTKSLDRMVDERGANLLVLDAQAQADHRIVGEAGALHERGTRVRTLSLFYEEWIGKLPISELERVSLLFDVGEIHRARYARSKRAVDLVLAVLCSPLLALVAPLAVIGNLVANRGPLIFHQDRVGKGGRTFRIYKFRTMTPGTQDGDWTVEGDPRVTSFGRVLRATHLDELPQVVNVLKGDLSFIGPRPEQPRYVAELVAAIPFYRFRHLVRPGLTGWAQVNYGYGADEQDAMQKLQYDFYYLRRQGTRLDLLILARTARSLIIRPGR